MPYEFWARRHEVWGSRLVRDTSVASLVASLAFICAVLWQATVPKEPLPKYDYVGNGGQWAVFDKPCPDPDVISGIVGRQVLEDQYASRWGGCPYFASGYTELIVNIQGEDDVVSLFHQGEESVREMPDLGPGAEVWTVKGDANLTCAFVLPVVEDSLRLVVEYDTDSRYGEEYVCYIAMKIVLEVAEQQL